MLPVYEPRDGDYSPTDSWTQTIRAFALAVDREATGQYLGLPTRFVGEKGITPYRLGRSPRDVRQALAPQRVKTRRWWLDFRRVEGPRMYQDDGGEA